MRVIVTRPQAQARALVGASRGRVRAGRVPRDRDEPIDDGPIDTTGYDWVIVTSANGAAELGARRIGVLPRVAAVGEMTAAALAAQEIPVEFVPTLASQEGLLAEFPRPVGRALFVGAERAPPAARRRAPGGLPRLSIERWSSSPAPPDGDVVLVASPSARARLGKARLGAA